MPTIDPPLRGDGNGSYKTHIVGNKGAGKSTLSAYLSTKLHIPHISLDEIAWQPGWQKKEADAFRGNVSALMAQNTRGWIVDGDYRALGTLVPDNATDIIWLDPPLHHCLPRLIWRTLMRILGLRSPCAEGCKENWGEIFSRKGIVWSCVRKHAIYRTQYKAWLSRMNVEGGEKMIRLDESHGELERWKDDLEKHLQKV
ncbi:hypothetical protein V8E55_004100 [Tylopilus felleus]